MRRAGRGCGTRLVDPRATDVRTAAGLALAAGTVTNGRTTTGMGLAAYGADGVLRWHRFGEAPLGGIPVVGGRAYVAANGAWHVVDAASGRIVATRRGARSLHVIG